MTIQEKAREAAGWFETATRGDTGKDEDRYTRTKDDAPEWVADIVYAAHGDLLPDDWRYEAISSALEAIADSDDPEDEGGEWADGHVDVYTGARFAWLASNLSRAGYVDEARSEGLIGSDTDIVDQIGVGQYMEASEVYGLVVRALEELMEAEGEELEAASD